MDDAGVYRISDELALVQTLDFFTPIVDDPFMYGQIAAANALSDVYAMGAKPMTALSVSCFPVTVEPEILAEILRGGQSKIKESGAVLLGGHTVTDEELKYGLSVTGTVHPSKVFANAGAKAGDALILTKPIGTGILTTAFKFDLIDEQELSEAAEVMSTLNKAASEAMQRVGANACTDITGFGLLGHSLEMAKASRVQLIIDSQKIPKMNRVTELIKEEAVPGGAYSNMTHFDEWITFSEGITIQDKIALFDPQTSGGLLISVPAEKAEQLVDDINRNQPNWARIIGEVASKDNQSQKYIKII